MMSHRAKTTTLSITGNQREWTVIVNSLHSEPLGTLPPQLTSFIGREDEIAVARDLLQTTRLLTLTGAGGSGKTRLAIAIAERVQDVFTDGVVFVSLAPITEPARVSSAIAEA